MTDNENKNYYSVSIIEPTRDLEPIIEVLNEEDRTAITQIQEELADNWRKKQIFRTETEMRISVLNDGKHPTRASKYWQSVREMSAHFDGLMSVSFDIKRNAVKKLRLERELQEAIDEGDDLRELELRIDLEENLYEAASAKQVAQDRVREITTWSKIKDELNDGSFDTENVNTHQANSYHKALQNRVRALNANSGPAEIINAVGPLQTVQRLKTEEGKLLDYKSDQNIKLIGENNEQ